MKREKQEILPTMKAQKEVQKDNELAFKEMDCEIKAIKDIDTKFGTKTLLTVQNGKTKFNLFANAKSINNLIEAFGEEDENYIGQFVSLKLETDKNYNKDMIVVYKK